MADNNENKVLNVPHLRFPEFSGEWEEHTLSEYLEFKNGLNPDAKRIGSGLPFISVMDILSEGVINYDNIRGKVNATEKEIECFGVKDGDLLFQRSSETLEDVGRANVYMDNRTAIYGGFVIRGRKIGNYDPLFFKYLLATPLARKRTCRMGAGAQHFNIGQEGLSKISLYFPSIEEQRKIAEFLSLIDERIATQNKIIEKLQSLIKGLAVALTTKEKANIAISQCLECHSSTLQESEVLSSGLCKVFGANGLVGYKDVPQMNGDAILVIKDGSGVGTVSYAQGKFSVIGTLNYLTVIGNNDLRYLYFALSVFNFQPYKTGMAIPHIYFKDYGKAKIYCPSLAEQKRVANVLDKLESKLFVEQELLASFNQQKLYLLGKMFI
ncbi:restriction endonuclease subunit S [Phocaeicola vulgatus]|uniref:Restriction endonuclease subunit S n=1 Tax=Bacteroides cellulosilyticus TaxID=246787 RepID=A0A6L3K1E2_9BACE|nr:MULTISPECIES: restriction endonuclease subunit S [Bacteroidaceae]KAA5418988.1 restriction endonuclease subunit S [Bacteroides cellulosilyticus]MBV3851191.1 restriction endonuclease subunit S [Phocaeicola vulgatus]MBV3860253.1 restriction endonuclease subunit S [Phocaeicola vulgatus]MBV3864285.1 restriction endonuclease subunit S [Phocaeicola vulgatus]MBV3871901.1 restriction endonuclease subunit S [Phocaeicola vulgatus]